MSRSKGGTLIAEHVHDLAAHERLLFDLDGYRPRRCPQCGGDVLHAHDHAERRPRGAPDLATKIRVRRYICANKACLATWRVLPAFLARRLWRVWPTVEHLVLPARPPSGPTTPVAVLATPPVVAAPPAVPATPPAVPATLPAPVPGRTVRRWRGRLASAAKQLVLLLAISGGAALEAIAKRAGLEATRFELLDVYANEAATPLERRLADLAALIHRLDGGLRLM